MIEFFPGKQNAKGEDVMDLVARGFCKTHLKIARRQGYEMPARTKRFCYETVSQAKRKLLSLVDGDDGDIFENEVGDESSSDENQFGSQSMHVKRKAKTQHPAASNVARKSKPFKGTEYFEKKRQIEEYSSQMEADFEKRLTAGDKVEKALKIVTNFWKSQLSTGIYKKCRDKANIKFRSLILTYTQKKELTASGKDSFKRRRRSGRWENLFLPNFTFGSVLTTDWDEEREIRDL